MNPYLAVVVAALLLGTYVRLLGAENYYSWLIVGVGVSIAGGALLARKLHEKELRK